MVDIADEAFRNELEQWITSGESPASWLDGYELSGPRSLSGNEQASDDHLQKAVDLLDKSERDSPLEELRQAARLDPENWLIRKQEWAIEAPEAFYGDEVNYEWQTARIKAENEQSESDSA
jgi:hypothetical protein